MFDCSLPEPLRRSSWPTIQQAPTQLRHHLRLLALAAVTWRLRMRRDRHWRILLSLGMYLRHANATVKTEGVPCIDRYSPRRLLQLQ